jgi:hypothetical protein
LCNFDSHVFLVIVSFNTRFLSLDMIENIKNFIILKQTMSFDSEQTSFGDLYPLSPSTGAGGHFDFDMHPYAPPPASESMNEMHLADENNAEVVSADQVAIIFSFLPPKDIMRARVCTTWRAAAKKTLVPMTGFSIYGLKSFNAMRVMASALPNLQQQSISNINGRHKYIDGEDPDERRARDTANYTTHDINIISNFLKLRNLEIRGAHLSGRYPVLFTFPQLRKLSIKKCLYLKFDLEMLVGTPLLKELRLIDNLHLTGNLESSRALRDTLEKLVIRFSRNIKGNFMDLADFPRLKYLDLVNTSVTGDIRQIRGHDFPALENLSLPETVRGGACYKFQHISDVPSFMHAIYILVQRTPKVLIKIDAFNWSLSEASPNWYDWDEWYDWESETMGIPPPPFYLRLVRAGSRRGWSWCTYGDEDERYSCEINWLNPEPSSDSSGYQTYIEELQRVQRNVNFYRGYYEIPTEDEYHRLCEELPLP